MDEWIKSCERCLHCKGPTNGRAPLNNISTTGAGLFRFSHSGDINGWVSEHSCYHRYLHVIYTDDTLPLGDQEAPNGLVESEVKENPLDEEPVDQLGSDSDVRLDPTQLPDHDSLRKSWSCPSQIPQRGSSRQPPRWMTDGAFAMAHTTDCYWRD